MISGAAATRLSTEQRPDAASKPSRRAVGISCDTHVTEIRHDTEADFDVGLAQVASAMARSTPRWPPRTRSSPHLVPRDSPARLTRLVTIVVA